MKTIIIYTDAHRDACLYDCQEDAAAYDCRIEDYFRQMVTWAEEDGYRIEFEIGGSGRSYYSDHEDAHEWMQTQPSFWEWY